MSIIAMVNPVFGNTKIRLPTFKRVAALADSLIRISPARPKVGSSSKVGSNSLLLLLLTQ